MDKKPAYEVADILKDKFDNYYLVLDIQGDRLTVQSMKYNQPPIEVSANMTKHIAEKIS